MRIRKLFLTVAIAFTAIAASAQTDGFSYQAVVRNSKGELVSNKSVGIQLTIANSDGSNVMYSETQTAKTNAYGVLSVTVGSGTPQNGGSLSNVNWAGGQAWLHVGIDVNGGSSYTSLGATKIQAVPVALYAARSGNSSQNGGVNNPTDSGDALFEVKDNDGNVVFAVYPNEVRVYVDENDSKVKRSGLIVTGRNTKGDSEKDYLIVNPTGTQVFVDENDGKVKRSGLIVTGRNTKGDAEQDYLIVNPTGTQVIVDENDGKVKRSGLIVTGRNTKDDAEQDYLVVNPSGTKVIVDEGDGKVKRSGLVVTGRNTKGDGEQDYLVVDPSGTQVIVDDELDNDSKVPRSGFVVTGRNTKDDSPTKYLKVATDGTLMHFDKSDAKVKRSGLIVTGRNTKGTDQEYFNIDAAQDAKTLNEENRIYWYPERNAFMAGNLLVEHPDSVGTNSFNAGYQNKAIGEYSQAFGYKSVATGKTSIAIGDSARSAGKSSFAFGRHSVAIGDSSVAIGSLAIAKDTNAYAFGNGAKALAPGSYAIGTGATTSGANAVSIGTEANATKEDAYAFGYKAQATGKSSLALGAPSIRHYNGEDGFFDIHYEAAKAEGDFSYAIGSGTEALEEGTVAIGVGSKATYAYDVAIGGGEAKGGGALVIGASVAEGIGSTAVGYKAKATGMLSMAIGNYAEAIADNSIAFGTLTEAKKPASTAIGVGTVAEYAHETVVGYYNTIGNSYYHDKLFVIGNGDPSDGTRSDAMVVLDNGNLIVGGDLWPSKIPNDVRYSDIGSGNWNMWFNRAYITNGVQLSSDQRLKTNIKPLEKALDKVLTLNGVTYEWRVNEFPDKNFDSNRHVGVIAQEVEAVLPEAVETGGDGYKSVNYSNITPLLIEAIKEQQAEIEELKSVKEENEALKAKVEKLEKMMEELLNKQ